MQQYSESLWGVVHGNLRRALAIALFVGTVLVLVNHGDHIEQEPVCEFFFLKAGLCYFVPFAVSMVSVLMSASRQTHERP